LFEKKELKMMITFARDEADFDLIAAWRVIGQLLW
jgi:hypothetical protein